jgi:Raf kinase inhibitor-like YbhB/YbcL family protein
MLGFRSLIFGLFLYVITGSTVLLAHPGHSHAKRHANEQLRNEAMPWLFGEFAILDSAVLDGDEFVSDDSDEIDAISTDPVSFLLAMLDPTKPVNDEKRIPEMARAFDVFVKDQAIRTRWDERFLYVESHGIPAHQMMVGITAWQQQVPLPQAYRGENAWQIPLKPVPAKNPASTRNRFLRGAIALAANGIPIFNPLNNRGEDSYAIGELDEFGGHCGRADDYHYHIAPVHLEKILGKGLPIAYALDGYPIYGYEEPDGSKVTELDAFNGHTDAKGNYHYHATKTYPYLNGGFHGEVTERGGQVDPQPRAEPVRPDTRPLRDAKITDFVETKPNCYVLTYDVKGKKGSISYTVAEDGSAKFTFVDPNGSSKSETYSPRRRGNDRRPSPPRPDGPPPRPDGPPPRNEDRPPRNLPPGEQAANRNPPEKAENKIPSFTVTSSALDVQGNITAEYTCDGASASPALEWKGFPQDTKSFAISLWHTAPDQEKSYWVIYNIPAGISKIDKNAKNIGTTGLNDKRRAAYDPMCSKGPGVKKYHITIYALSAEPKLAADQATRANLLNAIKDITIAKGTLDFTYERKK